MSVIRTTAEDNDAADGGVAESILPLRLTAFENYMLVDDRPSHPMVFVIELDVSGRLQIEPLRAAIAFALTRHPLLTARVGWRLGGRCWVPARQPPSVEVISEAQTHQIAKPYIDLRRHTGLKVWIVPGDQSSKVYFAVHHATTDGIGAMEFIGDALVDYARRTALPGEEVPELRELDQQVLKERSCIDNPAGGPGPSRLARAVTFFRQMGRSASRLATPEKDDTAPDASLQTLPPFVSRTLDRAFLNDLKRAAARRLLHVNDLYVASVYKSVYDWNHRYGQADDDRIIRMSLPASLRTPRHDGSPAANVVNMVFVNRRQSQCGNLDSLLKLAGETANASTHDRLFFRVMRWGRYLPGVMFLSTRVPYNFATMVLSNVGDVKRQFGTKFPLARGKCVAGSITIEGLRGTPPLRPGTHVGISLGTYAGSLLINISCDPQRYTRQDAARFLDLFIQQLSDLSSDNVGHQAA